MNFLKLALSMFYRSSMYSSDVGKMIGCPVLHVNGDNPEVLYTSRCVTCFLKRGMSVFTFKVVSFQGQIKL